MISVSKITIVIPSKFNSLSVNNNSNISKNKSFEQKNYSYDTNQGKQLDSKINELLKKTSSSHNEQSVIYNIKGKTAISHYEKIHLAQINEKTGLTQSTIKFVKIKNFEKSNLGSLINIII